MFVIFLLVPKKERNVLALTGKVRDESFISKHHRSIEESDSSMNVENDWTRGGWLEWGSLMSVMNLWNKARFPQTITKGVSVFLWKYVTIIGKKDKSKRDWIITTTDYPLTVKNLEPISRFIPLCTLWKSRCSDSDNPRRILSHIPSRAQNVEHMRHRNWNEDSGFYEQGTFDIEEHNKK